MRIRYCILVCLIVLFGASLVSDLPKSVEADRKPSVYENATVYYLQDPPAQYTGIVTMTVVVCPYGEYAGKLALFYANTPAGSWSDLYFIDSKLQTSGLKAGDEVTCWYWNPPEY